MLFRAVLTLALISSACSKNDKPPPPSSGSPSATPETGPNTAPSAPPAAATGTPDEQAAKIFRDTCVMCHGASGKGDGQMAQSLNPKPRNYTDPAWQASVTDEDIKTIILEGGKAVGKSDAMPSMKSVLGDQPEVLDALVRIVRKFGQQ